MNRHKISISKVLIGTSYPKTNTEMYDFSTTIDSVKVKCRCIVTCFPGQHSKLAFRLLVSGDVKRHPDYQSIRREIFRQLANHDQFDFGASMSKYLNEMDGTE